jgi:hypothetical protein
MTFTLELDDALGAQIEAAARARGISAREFIRTALELTVAAPAPVSPARPAFVQKTHDFGASIDTAWTLLAEVESNDYLAKNSRK